ncbi:hypothetical protein [Vibrio natriegens]|jgi:hypothetical protein|uniref:hypothetical protein n=1 Tax=Vibrio natriegens TaxID=691 RepID=UPI003B59F24F
MISTKHKVTLLTVTPAVMLLFVHLGAFAQTKQEQVHHMSHQVMPFDMSKTLHVFKMTDSGGVQKVLARNTEETEQILLIRQHLEHEAQMFKHGNYSDPTKLHGDDMPGIAKLSANPSKVNVSYSELPEGAQITFETKEISMVTAIHRWFGAQLSEHGADAKSE